MYNYIYINSTFHADRDEESNKGKISVRSKMYVKQCVREIPRALVNTV